MEEDGPELQEERWRKWELEWVIITLCPTAFSVLFMTLLTLSVSLAQHACLDIRVHRIQPCQLRENL